MSGAMETELNEAAAPAEPVKKARKPKHAAEGEAPKAEKAPKAPKAPKLVPQLDDEGNPVLDENGLSVMVEAPKKARSPKLDAEGNPVVYPRVPKNEAAVINVDLVKIANYKGQRGEQAKPLKDGMTIGEFFQAGGDAGFLRFYARDGAVTFTE